MLAYGLGSGAILRILDWVQFKKVFGERASAPREACMRNISPNT